MKRGRTLAVAAVVSLVATLGAAAHTQQSPPVPRPFPGTTPPPPAAPKPTTQPPGPTTTAPVPPPAATQAADGGAGAYAYPGAEFITSFDAGRGQRYFLYGTNASFTEIVQYYRTSLKAGGGRELMKLPPMQQFDLGRFDENAMIYPPSIVVKDYTWNNSAGYLAVNGTAEKRYKTIIQIVPPGPVR